MNSGNNNVIPGWGIACLLAALLLYSSVQLIGALNIHGAIKAQKQAMLDIDRRARITGAALNKLAGSLIDLSSKNPNASKIVEEFGLKRNAAAGLAEPVK